MTDQKTCIYACLGMQYVICGDDYGWVVIKDTGEAETWDRAYTRAALERIYGLTDWTKKPSEQPTGGCLSIMTQAMQAQFIGNGRPG